MPASYAMAIWLYGEPFTICIVLQTFLFRKVIPVLHKDNRNLLESMF